jgi:hypothetical protein
MNKTLAFVSLSLLVQGCSQTAANPAAEPPPAPTVPDAIRVPDANDKVLLRAAASGVQIYTCSESAGTTSYGWTLTAPDAMLFDDHMKMIGHHFAGPSWELTDGSKIEGMAVQKAASPDSTAIPWLLVKVVSHSGNGELSAASYVQRINTTGGQAPASGCDSSKAGTETRVDYTADYYFWGAP